MAAQTPWAGLNEYGEIMIYAGGSSPTCTTGSFATVDTTNKGVINCSSGADTCCGIFRNTTATANAEVVVATSGVWKTTGTASSALSPGDKFYIATATTVEGPATCDHSQVSQGIVVGATAATGATTLYILLVPSEIYTATTYTTG